MVLVKILCRHCQSDEVIKFGFTEKGTPRFRCHACQRTFCLEPDPRTMTPEREALILAAYQERPSMRGIARIFSISRNTLSQLLKKNMTNFPP